MAAVVEETDRIRISAMRWPRRLIALFLVGVLGLYPLLAPPPHRIDKAHCDLIKEGMTKDEVESIFGAPPGEYDFAETKVALYQLRISAVHTALRWKRESISDAAERAAVYEFYVAQFHAAQALRVRQRWPSERSTWTGCHGAFTVSFDEQGRVISTRGPAEVTIVPPWQRWWKKLTE
jgi:hypothetical protein